MGTTLPVLTEEAPDPIGFNPKGVSALAMIFILS